MGKRGPLPESSTLARLKGRDPSTVKLTLTAPSATVLKMPSDLPPLGRKFWRAVVPKLIDVGLVTEVDRVALRDMAICYARLETAEADIAARGLLVEGDRGMVKNPSCQLAREYRRSLLAWATRFGLTPGDRDRMRNPGKTDEEPSLQDVLYGYAEGVDL